MSEPAASPAPTEPTTTRGLMPVAQGGTVHLGVRHSVHTEWFYWLVGVGWLRFFGALTAGVLSLNVAFALGYYCVPEQLANFDGTFASAFAFSVQTLFTIGYGAMAPTGWAAHALVTLEAVVGMMFNAVITGLVFARVSRPRSRVLFSNVAVIAPMDGVPTLAFRLANARGNEVLDASIRVVMLVDTRTREGHQIRRMLELTPERSYSPIFRLSWTVMHRLDERSPLTPLARGDALDASVVGFVCLLTAYDATLHSSMHTQHVYRTDALRFGHRLVDVVTSLPDGRFSLDYQQFHDSVPLDAPSTTEAPAGRAASNR